MNYDLSSKNGINKLTFFNRKWKKEYTYITAKVSSKKEYYIWNDSNLS